MQHCQYHDDSGATCKELAGDDGFCFWHSKHSDKSGIDIANKLKEYIYKGGQTRGICLKSCELASIDLVNHGKQHGYDFSYADLYHANLQDAHLFNIQLNNASLMKADLTGANLNCSQLNGCNLLGTRLEHCKIDNIDCGTQLMQEKVALTAKAQGNQEIMMDNLQQAEEIYRNLRKCCEKAGLFSLGGEFLKRELTMRRYQMPLYSTQRILSKIVQLFSGYGEEPSRVVFFSLFVIFICAILYFIFGIQYSGEHVQLSLSHPTSLNVKFFFECLYYSVVTFTTLGYGDFVPIGISRAFAAIEAFVGSFTIALFVVVFVKKMTR